MDRTVPLPNLVGQTAGLPPMARSASIVCFALVGRFLRERVVLRMRGPILLHDI